MKKEKILKLILRKGFKRDWGHDSMTACAIHAVFLMKGEFEIEQFCSTLVVKYDGGNVCTVTWDDTGVSFSAYNDHYKLIFLVRLTIETIDHLKNELPLTMQ